jgi:hypothetical protein
MVREPDATRQPTPHDNQLISKHRGLSLKPQLRLEWRSQDGQNETEQPDHSASSGDSITSSTRIRFSVHTGLRTPRGSCGSAGLVTLRSEAVYRARHNLQRIHLFASLGSCRASSAAARVALDGQALERDRLCLRLSRLCAFSHEVPAIGLVVRLARTPDMIKPPVME